MRPMNEEEYPRTKRPTNEKFGKEEHDGVAKRPTNEGNGLWIRDIWSIAENP